MATTEDRLPFLGKLIINFQAAWSKKANLTASVLKI